IWMLEPQDGQMTSRGSFPSITRVLWQCGHRRGMVVASLGVRVGTNLLSAERPGSHENGLQPAGVDPRQSRSDPVNCLAESWKVIVEAKALLRPAFQHDQHTDFLDDVPPGPRREAGRLDQRPVVDSPTPVSRRTVRTGVITKPWLHLH